MLTTSIVFPKYSSQYILIGPYSPTSKPFKNFFNGNKVTLYRVLSNPKLYAVLLNTCPN